MTTGHDRISTDDTERRERARCEAWRVEWIDGFATRQRERRAFISFIELADKFARDARTIAEETERKTLAYRRLTDSAWRGEFEKNGRSRVLLLETRLDTIIPCPDDDLEARRLGPNRKFQHPPHRPTHRRLKEEVGTFGQDFRPGSELVTGLLQYCWLPRDLADQWLKQQGMSDPAVTTVARAGSRPAGTKRKRAYKQDAVRAYVSGKYPQGIPPEIPLKTIAGVIGCDERTVRRACGGK